MKTTIVSFMLFFCAVYTAAQTNYYTDTKTFQENGYTYQCDVSYGLVKLYNKENKLTYVRQIFKDTKEVPGFGFDFDDVVEETWTKPKSLSIVNNAFTAEQKQRMGTECVGICMYISPETGKVVEVAFDFTTVSSFATIPLSVYRKIEVELKQQIWFTPTKDGKRLNHLMRSWMHRFKE
ncbi:DUF5043 domain-containing protein [Bacteroides heparinolyticus]|uniref:DUF5043 domain-containing protein n=1 Tax=Prevotella heparinolytica TaxID=28113 RepID=UPI00359FCD11